MSQGVKNHRGLYERSDMMTKRVRRIRLSPSEVNDLVKIVRHAPGNTSIPCICT